MAVDKKSSSVAVDIPEDDDSTGREEPFWKRTLVLTMCFIGLQGSFLSWGVLQEKLMTHEYSSGRFRSSTFLTMSNRMFGLVLGGILVHFSEKSGNLQGRAPFYSYGAMSVSNVVSSFAQLEALKHVSFPLQVLSKACKIIPVMLMGKLLQRKKYDWIEYVEAVFMTMGAALFMSFETKKRYTAATNSVLGMILLCVYLAADSFTSQWQDKVFKQYHVTEWQMMFNINLCSVTFTATSMLLSGELMPAIAFFLNDKQVMADVLLFSGSSTIGQLFIFFTIKKFGPIVFTLMMTARQMLSFGLSCYIYGHHLGAGAWIGASVVFAVLIYRTKRKIKK